MIFNKPTIYCKSGKLPANISADDVYLMVMLHKYQRKSCAQIARQFGITRDQTYNILAKKSVGGCCG